MSDDIFDAIDFGDHGALPENETKVEPERRPRGRPRGTFKESIFESEEEMIKARFQEASMLPEENEEEEMPAICKKLNPKQKLVIRFKSQGLKNTVIANMVGYTVSNVSLILSSPEGKAFLQYLGKRLDAVHDEVGAVIQQGSLRAVARVLQIINDPEADEKLVAQCSFDILDRAGHKPVNRVHATVDTNAITKDDLDKLNQNDEFLKGLYTNEQSREAGDNPEG